MRACCCEEGVLDMDHSCDQFIFCASPPTWPLLIIPISPPASFFVWRGGASWSSHKKGAYIHNWPRHQLLFIFHFFEQTNSCFFSKNVNKTLLYYYNWPPPKLCDLCHHSSLKRVFPSVFFSRNILLTNLLANNHNSMCRNKWEKMERWKIQTYEHRV